MVEPTRNWIWFFRNNFKIPKTLDWDQLSHDIVYIYIYIVNYYGIIFRPLLTCQEFFQIHTHHTLAVH